MTRIVGLDLSLTATGLARVETGAGANVVGLHGKPIIPATVEVRRIGSKAPAHKKGDPPPSIGSRSLRLRRLAGQITEQCAGADLVVVEGPSYASEGAGTWDRAGLWWLVVARLTGAGLNVVEVPPSNVKMYALGKGGGAGTGKDEVLAAVIRRYLPVVEVPGNNEADALAKAIDAFGRLNVTADMLEGRLQRGQDRWDAQDVADLTVLFQSLRSGDTTVADEFATAPAGDRAVTAADIAPPPAGPA